MEIKKLNSNHLSDFKGLLDIFKRVFEHEEAISDYDQLSTLLANPKFMVFVVLEQHRVVGGLTLYVLDRYLGRKPIAYIYDVAIDVDFQGQGLGKALIEKVCASCRENDITEVFVQADAEDIEAIAFYRRTSFQSEMNAVQFTYHIDHLL